MNINLVSEALGDPQSVVPLYLYDQTANLTYLKEQLVCGKWKKLPCCPALITERTDKKSGSRFRLHFTLCFLQLYVNISTFLAPCLILHSCSYTFITKATRLHPAKPWGSLQGSESSHSIYLKQTRVFHPLRAPLGSIQISLSNKQGWQVLPRQQKQILWLQPMHRTRTLEGKFISSKGISWHINSACTLTFHAEFDLYFTACIWYIQYI